MQFEVRNRVTGNVQFTAQIEADDETPRRVKLGMAVGWADLTDADLRGADLRGADLRGAELRRADLTDADLTDADLGKIEEMPTIPLIHSAVYAAASQNGALDMGTWHKYGFCGTTHCRAGWVTHLAGDDGRHIENLYGTPAAAALIYQASDPQLGRIPNFYADAKTALADMKRLADAESNT